ASTQCDRTTRMLVKPLRALRTPSQRSCPVLVARRLLPIAHRPSPPSVPLRDEISQRALLAAASPRGVECLRQPVDRRECEVARRRVAAFLVARDVEDVLQADVADIPPRQEAFVIRREEEAGSLECRNE